MKLDNDRTTQRAQDNRSEVSIQEENYPTRWSWKAQDESRDQRILIGNQDRLW
jgi:hypothetical protein